MLASRTSGRITPIWSRSTPPRWSILLLSNLINLWRFPDFGSLHVFCTAIFNCVSAAAVEPDGRYFSAAHLNVNWGTALHNCFHKYHGILRQREPAAVLAQFQPLFVSHRPYSHHNYLPTMILSYQTIPLGLLLYSLFLYVKLLDTEMLSVLYIFCLCFSHVMSIR